jgi:hypothetical protein
MFLLVSGPTERSRMTGPAELAGLAALGGSRLITGDLSQSLRSLSWLASLRSAARA